MQIFYHGRQVASPLDIFERLIGPEVLKSCSSSSEASPSSSLNCRLRPRAIGSRGTVNCGLRLAELDEERLDSAEGAGEGGVQKDVLNELGELVGGNDEGMLLEVSMTAGADSLL